MEKVKVTRKDFKESDLVVGIRFTLISGNIYEIQYVGEEYCGVKCVDIQDKQLMNTNTKWQNIMVLGDLNHSTTIVFLPVPLIPQIIDNYKIF